MINNCNLNDIDKIKELGSLINKDFSKVNNIEEIINNNEIIGYYDNNKLVGYLIYKKIYEVIDLLYVVVDPKYRRKGIGSILLESLFKLDYERIMLEVNVANKSAIKLYKKYNFKIINIRNNYYGIDSAYVMEAKK